MTPSEEIKNMLIPILSRMRAQGSTEAEIIAYRNGFTVGSMWRGAHPCWVSVKDELPKKDGRYLFYDEVLGPRVSAYYVECTLAKEITHWMPLPQPPSCFQFRKKAMNDEERLKKTIEEEENFYENLKWEQRRYEIARDVTAAIISRSPMISQTEIDNAVKLANMLVSTLRKSKVTYGVIK